MPPYIAPEANAGVGFWGKTTSTLDWCEENYVTSFYIAEFCEPVARAATAVGPLTLASHVNMYARARPCTSHRSYLYMCREYS